MKKLFLLFLFAGVFVNAQFTEVECETIGQIKQYTVKWQKIEKCGDIYRFSHLDNLPNDEIGNVYSFEFDDLDQFYNILMDGMKNAPTQKTLKFPGGELLLDFVNVLGPAVTIHYTDNNGVKSTGRPLRKNNLKKLFNR